MRKKRNFEIINYTDHYLASSKKVDFQIGYLF
ncbi:MAG: hypothetical protein ACI86M_002024 [Saprospiraceae bacterium]